MKTQPIEYPFEIAPLSPEEGGGFAITFPDLPGCRSDSETPEEALENGGDALASWLAVAEELGDRAPKPFGAVSGRFVQRVPRSLHAQRIARAQQEGVSLNTLIVSPVSQVLGQRLTASPVARPATRTRSAGIGPRKPSKPTARRAG
ncbi:MAG: type II toxin-antitoxin system HicB family antitoxin [Holophagales bacterium]|nr:MAG: type II toxin-antitoxin system HicB family antitoxin [Holophagales bacterium]